MEKNFCECGKRIRKSSYQAGLTKCGSCHIKNMNKIHEEAKSVWNSGKCPRCGSKLVWNGALAGWFQCVQYGRWKETHGDVNKPNCGYQNFTK